MDTLTIGQRPIGFFDTGVGGISVLKEARKVMPNENYLYFGDSKNAPYGTKTLEEARNLTFKAVDFLINKGAKAIVIACNTATSVAINELREKYEEHIPIIGIEPAVKPALSINKPGHKVIIMATPLTLAEVKFKNLVESYDNCHCTEALPCPGLVEYIENGILDGEELKEFLQDKFYNIKDDKIGAVVLGCTHYPFVKDTIGDILGRDVPIIDGSLGTVKELKRKLEEYNILNPNENHGWVEIHNSMDTREILNLSHKLLNM